MKEVAGSIIVLAASVLMIAGKHFDSTLFWILGIVFLIEGAVLIELSLFFPTFFKDTRKWLMSKNSETATEIVESSP